jgi:cytidyltransferase-like protein
VNNSKNTPQAVAKEGYKPMAPHPIKQRALCILKGQAVFADRFVPDHKDLVALIDEFRGMGCKIAFVTGVWDLYHHGHGRYIETGKVAAQKLYPNAQIIMIVGYDTDALTKERKGPKRPIVPEEERAEVLSQIRGVDIVTPQYKANQLYKLIEHDVRIISTSTQDLPPDHAEIEAQCEHLVNLPPQAETSTSARIRRLIIDGGEEVLDRFEKIVSNGIQEMRDEFSKRK